MILKATVAGLIAFAPFAAAQAAADGKTMEALLVEVRQLRMALERSAVLAPKIQLVTQRLALQDQRIARLTAQLETVQKDIRNQADGIRQAGDVAERLEQDLATETDPMRRRDIERERSTMKALSGKTVNPQLTAREAELSSALQYERSVAQELSDRLATIDRMLDAATSPPAGQK